MKGKKLLTLLTVLAMLFVLAGCGASTSGSNKFDAMDVAPEAAPEAPAEGIYGNGSTVDSSSQLTTGQKLIKTVYINAETEDLETLLGELSRQINELGGYVESQEIYNGSSYHSYRVSSASMVVRVPAEKLSGFVSEVKGISNVTNYTESTDDVTLTYVSTESRITALETEQARLLELMAKAENMSDLLTIQERLTDVQYELENVTSRLRVLSNQVSYATIRLNLEQVEVFTEVEEPTVWQRITTGFTRNLKNIGEGLVDFFVWVVTYSPQLLLWAVIITVVVIVSRKLRAKRAAKRWMPPVQPPQKPDSDQK